VALTRNGRALLRAAVASIFIASTAVAPAAAQGNGKGNAGGKGKPKAGSGPATSGSAAPTYDATGTLIDGGLGMRQFGAWLDDASVLTPGNAWTSFSFGHYRSPGSSQTDFPVVDAGLGISSRTQFGITVPYYRVHFADGTNIGGLGDVFLSGKFVLIEPVDRRPYGVALSPVVEIAQDPIPGRGALTWGIPLSAEFRGDGYRVFGSSGYFSRGALFGSAAVEMPVTERLVATGALTLMRSVKADVLADEMGLAKGRTDLTASAAYFVSDSIAVFAGTGRTLGNSDGTATTFMLSTGVSVTFAPRVQ
jgi:hypothetical protein